MQMPPITKENNEYDFSSNRSHRSKENISDKQLIQQAVANTNAYNLAIQSALPGDTILLLERESYSFIGGIKGVNLKNITFDFAGYARFLYDTEFWPMRLLPFVHVIEEYAPGIETLDCMDKGN